MSSRIFADTTSEPDENTSASAETFTPQSRFVPAKITFSDNASIRQPLRDGSEVRVGIGRGSGL